MDKTILDLAQLFSNAKDRALPAEHADITPRAGETLITHQEYNIHREPTLRYELLDIVSFAAYCEEDIDDNMGIIFYNSDGITGLHNRLQPAGNRAYYRFELSPELRAWKNVKTRSHKRIRKFLEERLSELVDATIFQALATLKMSTSIHFESDFDDERNYGFIYQEREAKGSSKIPKELAINVPFFANDPPQKIRLRLTISQIKGPDATPLFTLEIIQEEKLLAENIAKLITRVRKVLPDHMILHGKY